MSQECWYMMGSGPVSTSASSLSGLGWVPAVPTHLCVSKWSSRSLTTSHNLGYEGFVLLPSPGYPQNNCSYMKLGEWTSIEDILSYSLSGLGGRSMIPVVFPNLKRICCHFLISSSVFSHLFLVLRGVHYTTLPHKMNMFPWKMAIFQLLDEMSDWKTVKNGQLIVVAVI